MPSRCALDFIAARMGAHMITVKIPFPLASAQQVVDAILERVMRRTRLALLDHVTSSTGLVLPLEKIVRELSARGIETLVDGAHAPGMIPLNLKKLGAAYYAGNCHKWICSPKGAALLYVRRDRQAQIRPLVISHGANSSRRDPSRFLLEFSWTGTGDFSAWLSVPESLRVIGAQLSGGWPAVMQRNRSLVLAARRLLCDALANTAAVPGRNDWFARRRAVAGHARRNIPRISNGLDPLRDNWLLHERRIEVPVFPSPAPPEGLLRMSDHFQKLAASNTKDWPRCCGTFCRRQSQIQTFQSHCRDVIEPRN